MYARYSTALVNITDSLTQKRTKLTRHHPARAQHALNTKSDPNKRELEQTCSSNACQPRCESPAMKAVLFRAVYKYVFGVDGYNYGEKQNKKPEKHEKIQRNDAKAGNACRNGSTPYANAMYFLLQSTRFEDWTIPLPSDD